MGLFSLLTHCKTSHSEIWEVWNKMESWKKFCCDSQEQTHEKLWISIFKPLKYSSCRLWVVFPFRQKKIYIQADKTVVSWSFLKITALLLTHCHVEIMKSGTGAVRRLYPSKILKICIQLKLFNQMFDDLYIVLIYWSNGT